MLISIKDDTLVFQLVLVLPRLTIPQLLSLFFPVECDFSHRCSRHPPAGLHQYWCPLPSDRIH